MPHAVAQPEILARERTPTGVSAIVRFATGAPRSLWGTQQRDSSTLLQEVRDQLPVIQQTISILAGFTGVPDVEGEDDAHTEEIAEFLSGVRVGWLGWGAKGLGAFLHDHIDQMLWTGRAVGECEVSAGRDDVAALWAYRSENFRLETKDDGTLDIEQLNAPGKHVLNPLTAFVSTYSPEGSDPYGRRLFRSAVTAAHAWTVVLLAHKQTWLRQGVPIFHVHIRLPDTYVDEVLRPAVVEDGVIVTRAYTKIDALIEETAAQINKSIKSQVEQGLAMDITTAGNFEATITQVHRETLAGDFETSKRNLIEEVIVAGGVPPSILGYSWSSTERMSRVQMGALEARIDCIRKSIEPVIHHILQLRQRLRGDLRPYTLSWPDVSGVELVDSARAARDDSTAELNRQRFWAWLWSAGIADQRQVSQELTGNEEIAEERDAPPGAVAEPEPDEQEREAPGAREEGEEPAR